MRSRVLSLGGGGDRGPADGRGRAGCGGAVRRDGEIGDAFGVEVDFAGVVAAEMVEEFGESALGTVLAIDEWSDDR